jgi:hypothetical protein
MGTIKSFELVAEISPSILPNVPQKMQIKSKLQPNKSNA